VAHAAGSRTIPYFGVGLCFDEKGNGAARLATTRKNSILKLRHFARKDGAGMAATIATS
jgi:hypothetical protein